MTTTSRPLATRVRVRATGRGSGEEGLRHLRIVALVVPASFVVGVLITRRALAARLPGHSGHLLIDAVLLVGTLLFSVWLFSLIDAGYRRLAAENRDLVAVESVTAAVRAARTTDEVAHAVLVATAQVTHARAVTLVATWSEGERRQERWGTGVVPEDGDVVQVPLMSGPDEVGAMTVYAPDRVGGPGEAALTEIGEVAGSALHRARYTAILQDECHRASDAERRRITREMHDSLAQALGAAHFRLAALAEHPDVQRLPQVRAEVEGIATTCHDAYGDVREAIHGLREGTRQDRSFVELLDASVRAFVRSTGIEATFTGPEAPVDVPDHAQAQALRVVQEALTNVRKHAGATTVLVSVRRDGPRLRVVVQDDGRGFDPGRAVEGHFGLSTMRERAQLVDGALTIDSAPGEGTRVELVVPTPTRMPA